MTQANSYASSSTGPTVIRLPVFAMAIVMASSLVAQVQAQSTQTLPAGYANTEGNSNNGYPWGTTDVRVQFCYDTRHFSSTSPILIRRMRFRADGSTIKKWAGGKFKDVAISMSTSVFDHLSLSTVFATNHGADKTVVYQAMSRSQLRPAAAAFRRAAGTSTSASSRTSSTTPAQATCWSTCRSLR
jgi:hypothetical protein